MQNIGNVSETPVQPSPIYVTMKNVSATLLKHFLMCGLCTPAEFPYQSFFKQGINRQLILLSLTSTRNALNGLVSVWLRDQLIDGGSIEQLRFSHLLFLFTAFAFHRGSGPLGKW